MLVRLGLGDTFDYRVGTQGAPYKVLPLRRVVDAYGQVVEAAPIVSSTEGPETLVFFQDVQRGGIAIGALACGVVEGMACRQPLVVTWQACAIMGSPFAPFDRIPRSALTADTLVYEDPDRHVRWVYDAALDGNLLTLRLREAPQWRQCQPPKAAVIDVVQGVMLEKTNENFKSELVGWTRAGPPLQIDSTIPPPARAKAPVAGGLPPGTARLEAHGFALGDAVRLAPAHSATLQTWMQSHPGWIVADASPGGGNASLGALPLTEIARWTVTLAAPNGDLFAARIEETREHTLPTAPTYSVVEVPAERRERYPRTFDMVEDLVPFPDFVEQAQRFVGPSQMPPGFQLKASPLGATYTYDYVFGVEDAGGLAAATDWLEFDAGTGRFLQANGDVESLSAFLEPGAG